jgi:glycosyltransferase involved in cell wall biosynthesis
MKILEVVPYYAPEWQFGGPVRAVYELSRALADRGNDVTVWTSRMSSASEHRNFSDNAGISDLGSLNVVRYSVVSQRFSRRTLMFITPRMILDLASVSDFDVIHLHDSRSFQNVVVSRAARSNGVPYVLSPHGSLGYEFGKVPLKRAYDMLWNRAILGNARRVIALTPFEGQQLAELGVLAEKTSVIPNGIERPDIGSAQFSRQQTRLKLGISKETIAILFIGRVARIKGVDLIVPILSELDKHDLNVRFFIAGPDFGGKDLMKKQVAEYNCQDRVECWGYITNPFKTALYWASDIFLLPSASEGLPIAALEAIGAGLPVVSTHESNLGSLLGEGQHVRLVARNPQSLAEAIINAIPDASVNFEERLGRANKAWLQIGWPVIAARMEALYSECISSAGA